MDKKEFIWKDTNMGAMSSSSLLFNHNFEYYEVYLHCRQYRTWECVFIYYPHDSEDYIWISIENFPRLSKNELPAAQTYAEELIERYINSGKDFDEYFKAFNQ